MASFESIGPCSLSPESSSLQGDPDLSVSEMALKSLSLSSSGDTPNGLSPLPASAKVPSYLGISCAVNGYAGFSRFCHGPSLNNGSSRLLLPPLKRSPPMDTLDRATNGCHQESQPDPKSLVQQRIESLYGKERANSLRVTRGRGPTLRSPSCPPAPHHGHRTPSRSPPVFKKLAPSFKEQLRTSSSTMHNSSASPKPAQQPPQTTSPGVVEHDGNWFLAVLERERADIAARMSALESELTGATGEEEAGQIRAALGQASLLLTSKLEHFRELCHNNLGQGPEGGPRATSADLAGLWDLISLQVEAVKKSLAPPTDARQDPTPATPSPRKSPAGKSPASRRPRPSQPRASREEARRRLAEAKQRAKKNQQAASADTDIAIFVAGDPPTNTITTQED